MSKKNRRNLLESLAARVDPKQHRDHLMQELTALKERASRTMIVVQHIENDPHAQEVEKAQVEQGYQQLESLDWRMEDIEARLAGMDDAHVESIAGPNRAARRLTRDGRNRKARLKYEAGKDFSEDDEDSGDPGSDPPATG
ncbi:hypothetical protein LCGC14_0581740 [marine sediment metagenome]|uniref:Uncharacterized protein n=1 Tax=marine sediment metagenome TaxID=412755 RepID=A0A0F9RL73_9ZZZZ